MEDNEMILERINGPADIKKLETNQLNVLAKEMRNALIKKTSACGGHLASNLGIVEITIGLHRVFDAPNDKIISDVSHQINMRTFADIVILMKVNMISLI